MQKIWDWFMISSANPEQTALTVKGSLMGAVTIFTILAGFAHVQVGDLTPIVDAIIAFMQTLFALISAGAVVWGLVRKVYLTIKGRATTV